MPIIQENDIERTGWFSFLPQNDAETFFDLPGAEMSQRFFAETGFQVDGGLNQKS